MSETLSIDGLPGSELIVRGIEDCAAGRKSVESMLVRIGWPRLESAGVLHGVKKPGPLSQDAELVLFGLLEERHGRAAYTEYRSLLNRLVSFERAADSRWRRDSGPKVNEEPRQ